LSWNKSLYRFLALKFLYSAKLADTIW